MSDWSGYAKSLALKFSYTNTFYSREPKLDITHPPAWTCDFLISSEVFEHVEPPVDRAFVGASRLIKPGGHLILSVPFVSGKTIEHYPNLATYKVVELGDDRIVVNRDKDGRYSVHERPKFHGALNNVLEMRLFGRDDLVSNLTQAGFTEMRFCEDAPQWGVVFRSAESIPLSARRSVSGPDLSSSSQSPKD